MKNLLLIFTLISVFLYGQQRLTPELLWQFERIGEFSVSPDNSKVVFSATKYNVEENNSQTELYIVDLKDKIPLSFGQDLKEKVDSKRTIKWLKTSKYSPVWRPDGNKIAFLAKADSVIQMWEVNPDGTALQQISDFENGVYGFKYSPDSRRIVFSTEVLVDELFRNPYSEYPKSDAFVIEDLMYRHWDEWEDGKYRHLVYCELANGKLYQPKNILNSADFDTPMKPFDGMEQVDWSADGNTIIYATKKLAGKDYAESTNSDIYQYNLIRSNTEEIKSRGKGYDKNPVFSPDGNKIALLSMNNGGYESDKKRLLVYDIRTRESIDFTESFDQSVEKVCWAEDNKTIYFLSGKEATFQIYKLNTEENRIIQLTEGQHDIIDFQLAGNKIVAALQTLSQPTELVLINIKNGKISQLTDLNQSLVSSINWGKVESRWIETLDKKRMLTQIIYPPEFRPKNKYPAILYCEGGPQSVVSQFFSYRWNLQLMAAKGYVVIAPNRRGATSFGSRWKEDVSRDYGGLVMSDLMQASDVMAEENYIDENKIGAVGASFGGYSVYWLAGNHNGRFSAFIAHSGMFNFESWYSTTEELFFPNKDLGGPYWHTDDSHSYKMSPHKFAQEWDTPILISHGQQDFRVPVSQSMEAFTLAQKKSIPSKFIYFPSENHLILSPQNSLLWQKEFFLWLNRYVKNARPRDSKSGNEFLDAENQRDIRKKKEEAEKNDMPDKFSKEKRKTDKPLSRPQLNKK